MRKVIINQMRFPLSYPISWLYLALCLMQVPVVPTVLAVGAWALVRRLSSWLGVAPQFQSRAVSSVHAILTAVLSLAFLTTGLVEPEHLVWTLQVLSISYCFYDVDHNRRSGTLTWLDTVFHHAVFTFFVWFSLPRFPALLAQAYLSEFTNPILHYCYYRFKTGQTGGAFKPASRALVLVYFLTRVVNFSYLIWVSYRLAGPAELAMAVSLTALNYYWFYSIVRLKRRTKQAAPASAPSVAAASD